MYNKTLEKDIKGDTSGGEREFFIGLINAPRQHVNMTDAKASIDRDVKELYLAGKGKGCPIMALFQVVLITATGLQGEQHQHDGTAR